MTKKAAEKLETFTIKITSKNSDLEIRCKSVERQDGLIIITPIDSKREYWIPMSKIDMVTIIKE